MPSYPGTALGNSDTVRQLTRPSTGLAFNLKSTPKPPPIYPPSYDPLSPSFDPSAASPCNPFPTTSPFATAVFTRPKAQSKLRFEGKADTSMDPTVAMLQTTAQHLQAAAVLARIPPPHSAPSLRRTKPCRFYLDPSGCKTGRWCNFKHPVGARAEDKSSKDLSLDEQREVALRSRGKAIDEDSRWNDVADIRDVDPNYGKDRDGDMHPKWRTQPCRNLLLGLCKYGDKCQFIHPPGLFPPATAPTAVPLPIPVDGPLSVPVSVWGAHPLVVAAESVPPSPEVPLKKKLASSAYRTKTCRFFEKLGSCPHGDGCKLIHDPRKSSPLSAGSSSSASSSYLPTPSTPWADDERELDFHSMPAFDMDVDSHSHFTSRKPIKEPRSTSQSRVVSSPSKEKKSGAIKEVSGIHKPTWRVVGGGVKLASPEKNKRISPSSTFSHSEEEDNEEDDIEILTYQPSITFSVASSHTTPSPPASLPPSPEYFTDGSAVTADLSQYNFVTPTNDSFRDLLRPPSSDFPLEITMASPDPWNTSSMEVAQQRRPQKRVTGTELMQAISSDESYETVSSTRTRGRAAAAARPQLTIKVPSTNAVPNSTYRHSPYPDPSLRQKKKNVAVPETVVEDGDSGLDWGIDEDEEELVQEEEQGLGVIEEEDIEEIEERMNAMLRVEDIKRPHSTPPTPGYKITGYVLEVPIVSHRPAESP